jgi:hypothetical protein
MSYQLRPNREDIRVGALVRAGHGSSNVKRTGIITSVEEKQSIFSEKYGITETNVIVRVLCDGEIMYFDLEDDSVEVISESR